MSAAGDFAALLNYGSASDWQIGEDGYEPALEETDSILRPNIQRLDGPAGSIYLSGIEWQLISYLWQHRGVIVTRDDLLLRFWGVSDVHSLSSLYEVISRLRRHIRMVGLDSTMIRAIPKAGYSLQLND